MQRAASRCTWRTPRGPPAAQATTAQMRQRKPQRKLRQAASRQLPLQRRGRRHHTKQLAESQQRRHPAATMENSSNVLCPRHNSKTAENSATRSSCGASRARAAAMGSAADALKTSCGVTTGSTGGATAPTAWCRRQSSHPPLQVCGNPAAFQAVRRSPRLHWRAAPATLAQGQAGLPNGEQR